MIDKNVLKTPNLEMEHVIYERIVCAVNMHRRTIELVYAMCSKHREYFLELSFVVQEMIFRNKHLI